MHFGVWINNSLMKGLEVLIRETGKKRNTIIAEALMEYLDKTRHQEWPDDIKCFKGIKGFGLKDRFEQSRSELKNLRDDIFEDKK